MVKLWGGRFSENTDDRAFAFNESLSFDRRLYKEDITGSIAHVTMLGKCGVLTDEETDLIAGALSGILSDIESGELFISEGAEDIHSFVEGVLTERIGEAGKKLHTGRSRNDQVALDMKLYVRNTIDVISGELHSLLETLYGLIKTNTGTFMPGFTHLQKAQSVSLSHHLSAYFEMFLRDRERLTSIRARLNTCPLGSGALAGTTYPLDRNMTAALLEFDAPTRNSMDSVSDRDYLIEFLNALSIIMMHLSRFCEEIIIWNSNEYRFIELDDKYSTGSSIMPQKKNPDIAELIRGKTGRVYGDLMALLTVMKAIPLAYDKDMQEDKEAAFDAIDTVMSSIEMFNGMLSTARFNKEIMENSARGGFTNATDVADYLVRKGVPFRDAHAVSGRLVLKCIDKDCALDDLSLEEFKEENPAFEEDIYDAISLKTCVEARKTYGACSEESMKEIISFYEDYLKNSI